MVRLSLFAAHLHPIASKLGAMGMNFDPTITFGAVINALVLLIGFTIAFTKIGGRIDLLALRIDSMEKSIESSRDFDKRIAIIEERQTNHARMIVNCQSDISELRHGRGFVQDRSQGGLDGEYL